MLLLLFTISYQFYLFIMWINILIETLLISVSLLTFCYSSKQSFLTISMLSWGSYISSQFYIKENYAREIGLTIVGLEGAIHYVVLFFYLILYPVVIHLLEYPVYQSFTYWDFWVSLLLLYPIYGWFQMYLFQSLVTLRISQNLKLVLNSFPAIIYILCNSVLFGIIHLGDRKLVVLTFIMDIYYTYYVIETRSILMLGPLHSFFATGYYYWILEKRVVRELLFPQQQL